MGCSGRRTGQWCPVGYVVSTQGCTNSENGSDKIISATWELVLMCNLRSLTQGYSIKISIFN